MKPCGRHLLILKAMRCSILLVLVVLEASLISSQARANEIKQSLVKSVSAVGMTTADLDRSVAFYSHVLSFKKVAESNQDSADYQELENVHGAKARIVRMRLGNGVIELTQFLTPKGKPIPPD